MLPHTVIVSLSLISVGWILSAMHRSCAQWGEAVTLAFIHGPKVPSSHVNPGSQEVCWDLETLTFLQWVRAQPGLIVQCVLCGGAEHDMGPWLVDSSLMPREEV